MNVNLINIVTNKIMKYNKEINKFLKELIANFIFNLIEKKLKMVIIIIYLMKLIQILIIIIIT